MNRVVEHIRNMLVAGALAAAPVAIIVAVAIWVEGQTEPIRKTVGFGVPGLGLLVVVVVLYFVGVFVTSFAGNAILALANRAISRVPGLNLVYNSWKDVLVASSAEEAALFQKVVLVPSEGENNWEMAFTSGRPLPGDPGAYCVFVPDAVNPFGGRLIIADQSAIVPLGMRPSEALKFLVSRGKYLPPDLRRSGGAPREATIKT